METQVLIGNVNSDEFEKVESLTCRPHYPCTQGVSGAPKQTHAITLPRANKWCSDFSNRPLRHRSYGKFDPYTWALERRFACETIAHPVNVPLPYSLVQL